MATERTGKNLKTAAGLLITIILLAAAFFGYFSWLNHKLNASSEAYARNQTELLMEKMDYKLLMKMADESMLESASTLDFMRLFNVLQHKLGTFRHIDSCEGKASIDITPGDHTSATAYYELETVFEKGTVTVQMYLVRSRGMWRIKAFNVKS